MSFNPEKYINALEAFYFEYAVADDQFFMKKYMKNKFEFFGLRKTNREAAEKKFLEAYGLPDYDDLDILIPKLWEREKREFQYFGLVVTRKFEKKFDLPFIKVIELMITNKSWWDTVDFVASNLAGNYFRIYPDTIPEITEKWMSSQNLWLQRSALLFQLKYKGNTDFDLMSAYILQLASSNEFFIRKAIGWCLREYSKTEPEKVISFVNEAPISNFSKKEALKWLERKKN